MQIVFNWYLKIKLAPHCPLWTVILHASSGNFSHLSSKTSTKYHNATTFLYMHILNYIHIFMSQFFPSSYFSHFIFKDKKSRDIKMLSSTVQLPVTMFYIPSAAHTIFLLLLLSAHIFISRSSSTVRSHTHI